jgi:hypothetical protein
MLAIELGGMSLGVGVLIGLGVLLLIYILGYLIYLARSIKQVMEHMNNEVMKKPEYVRYSVGEKVAIKLVIFIVTLPFLLLLSLLWPLLLILSPILRFIIFLFS